MNEEKWKTIYDVQVYVTFVLTVSYTHLTLPTNSRV